MQSTPSNTSTSLPSDDRAIRLPEVSRITGRSKTMIYSDARKGLFPKGFKIGLKARAWSLNEINAWLESRKQGGV